MESPNSRRLSVARPTDEPASGLATGSTVSAAPPAATVGISGVAFMDGPISASLNRGRSNPGRAVPGSRIGKEEAVVDRRAGKRAAEEMGEDSEEESEGEAEEGADEGAERAEGAEEEDGDEGGATANQARNGSRGTLKGKGTVKGTGEGKGEAEGKGKAGGKQKGGSSSEAELCSICLDAVDVCSIERSTARLKCGHGFHLGKLIEALCRLFSPAFSPTRLRLKSPRFVSAFKHQALHAAPKLPPYCSPSFSPPLPSFLPSSPHCSLFSAHRLSLPSPDPLPHNSPPFPSQTALVLLSTPSAACSAPTAAARLLNSPSFSPLLPFSPPFPPPDCIGSAFNARRCMQCPNCRSEEPHSHLYSRILSVVSPPSPHTDCIDCIGSAFNAKRRMQCPNCRSEEHGHWLLPFPPSASAPSPPPLPASFSDLAAAAAAAREFQATFEGGFTGAVGREWRGGAGLEWGGEGAGWREAGVGWGEAGEGVGTGWMQMGEERGGEAEWWWGGEPVGEEYAEDDYAISEHAISERAMEEEYAISEHAMEEALEGGPMAHVHGVDMPDMHHPGERNSHAAFIDSYSASFPRPPPSAPLSAPSPLRALPAPSPLRALSAPSPLRALPAPSPLRALSAPSPLRALSAPSRTDRHHQQQQQQQQRRPHLPHHMHHHPASGEFAGSNSGLEMEWEAWEHAHPATRSWWHEGFPPPRMQQEPFPPPRMQHQEIFPSSGLYGETFLLSGLYQESFPPSHLEQQEDGRRVRMWEGRPMGRGMHEEEAFTGGPPFASSGFPGDSRVPLASTSAVGSNGGGAGAAGVSAGGAAAAATGGRAGPRWMAQGQVVASSPSPLPSSSLFERQGNEYRCLLCPSSSSASITTAHLSLLPHRPLFLDIIRLRDHMLLSHGVDPLPAHMPLALL
ncbi:unnamed protein product [Closterium sp. Naga37s-1]|nr:unnamed protein product [Closterium sp. Naga37s-1]